MGRRAPRNLASRTHLCTHSSRAEVCSHCFYFYTTGGHRTDPYSAVLIFCLITGQTPFPDTLPLGTFRSLSWGALRLLDESLALAGSPLHPTTAVCATQSRNEASRQHKVWSHLVSISKICFLLSPLQCDVIYWGLQNHFNKVLKYSGIIVLKGNFHIHGISPFGSRLFHV